MSQQRVVMPENVHEVFEWMNEYVILGGGDCVHFRNVYELANKNLFICLMGCWDRGKGGLQQFFDNYCFLHKGHFGEDFRVLCIDLCRKE